jgi:hypothetical protein
LPSGKVQAAKKSNKIRTFTVKTEPNVRIRIRGAIIRIQITEPTIRTIIRIRREKGTKQPTPNIFINSFHSVFSCTEY